MTPADSTQDIWSRLRAYYQDDYAPVGPWAYRYHPAQYGRTRGFPPATEEQLRATEEQLGYPLPSDLRRLYVEVADGGINLGPVDVFRSAETLVSEGDWWLHPRIEAALLRHRGCYVITDSLPKNLLEIGGWHTGGDIAISLLTGYLYDVHYWDDLPDVIVNVDSASFEPIPLPLQCIQLVAPSLNVWFTRWLDDPWNMRYELGELLPEMVETDDLLDPEVVWRGLYRFGPAWHVWERPPDDGDYADSANDPIYMTYESLGDW